MALAFQVRHVEHRLLPSAPWFGVLGVTAGSLWLGSIGFHALSSERDFGGAIAAARGTMVGPALLTITFVLFACERRWPAVKRPALSRAHLVDAAYLALFSTVLVPALTVVQTGLAIVIENKAHFLILGKLPMVPQFLVLGAVLVGIDAMNWLAHVANHKTPTLWRLHALHHSQEDMSVFTTFRTHPLMHAPYLISMFPALVLLSSGGIPAAAIIAYGCLVTLPHSNLRWTFGPAGRHLVSPAYHRYHHARDLAETNGAVNFGFVLTWWDRLAGRAVFPAPMRVDAHPIATGIEARTVPVEQTVSYRKLISVMNTQIAQPFALRARTDGAR